MTRDLRQLFVSAEAVLFDFDGPICSVFDGYPAPQITKELRELARKTRPDLPPALEKASGPHELLLAAADDPPLAEELERTLQAAEMRAVDSARPTPGAAECLVGCHERGLRVAIVSNNYAEAVRSYLARNGLTALVLHVEGRDADDPKLMKPSPHLIDRAAEALGVRQSACVFIGDQTSDVEAARAAGCHAVGYANKPGKEEALRVASADAVARTMTDVASAIRGL